MKLVVQRVNSAKVEVNGKIVGAITKGFLVLLGVTHNDTKEIADYLVKKLCNLRVFEDENDVMNRSVIDEQGEILSISQFTLYGDVRKGNRPSYIKALSGDKAISLYEEFNRLLNNEVPTKDGVFGADMKVSLVNDGPTTIIIDTDNK